MMSNLIPLSIPNFEGNERKYVDDAVKQGWVSTGGAYINKLEQNMASFLKVNDVVACQSGTAGIHLALIRCGIRPGDLVLVPTLTFIAAVNPVRYLFADPIFMDCDDSLCMDPIKLKKFCQEKCHLDERTGFLMHNDSKHLIKAIVVVHVFGNLADMEAIMDIAYTYNLKVIEDATEALGSYFTMGKYENMYAGTIGDYGVYSFNGNKIITTGGGGAVVASDPDENTYLRYLSTQAKDDALFYIHNDVGYNYRMTNVQAALGVAQMEELPDFIRRKQENYEIYRRQLVDVEEIKLFSFREATCSNKWFYSLELSIEKKNFGLRDVINILQEKYKIQTRPIWGLIHEQKPYRGSMTYDICCAKYYSQRILNVPCSTQITFDEIDRVCKGIKYIMNQK